MESFIRLRISTSVFPDFRFAPDSTFRVHQYKVERYLRTYFLLYRGDVDIARHKSRHVGMRLSLRKSFLCDFAFKDAKGVGKVPKKCWRSWSLGWRSKNGPLRLKNLFCKLNPPSPEFYLNERKFAFLKLNWFNNSWISYHFFRNIEQLIKGWYPC